MVVIWGIVLVKLVKEFDLRSRYVKFLKLGMKEFKTFEVSWDLLSLNFVILWCWNSEKKKTRIRWLYILWIRFLEAEFRQSQYNNSYYFDWMTKNQILIRDILLSFWIKAAIKNVKKTYNLYFFIRLWKFPLKLITR